VEPAPEAVDPVDDPLDLEVDPGRKVDFLEPAVDVIRLVGHGCILEQNSLDVKILDLYSLVST
jgi:hypothetical protein